MGVNLRNDQIMAIAFFWERVHEATSDSSITGMPSAGMEMFPKEEYETQGRQWAT